MINIKSAEILCVGTELLLGDIINTNAAYLSKKLAELGINMYYQSVVGDNQERLKKTLSEALERSDLIIMSGGLGPTYDDLTKETSSQLMGKKMYLHQESFERLKLYLDKNGYTMSENNKKQAYMPEDAIVFINNYGTAPGLAIEDEIHGKIIIMLPGPPRELEPMFAEECMPYLAKFSNRIFFSKNINIFGMGESKVEEILKDFMLSSHNPTIAPYAKEGEVRLRVTACATNVDECKKLCDEAINKIYQSEVGKYIYGVDVDSLEYVLVSLLKQSGKKIATAESCTGGLFSKRITNIDGSSEVFDGGVVTYGNNIKEQLINVSHATLEEHGAVSSQTALEMARGVRNLIKSDIGVSITGIAGPNGGTVDKPIGLVYVAISTIDYEDVMELQIGKGTSTREYVRHISSNNALAIAIKYLRKNIDK